MCDQLTLAGFEPPEYLETAFLDSVLPTLQSVIAEHGGETTHLEYKSTSAASGSASGYTALFLHKFTVFRLHLRGKQHYIMLPRVFSDLIPAARNSACLAISGAICDVSRVIAPAAAVYPLNFADSAIMAVELVLLMGCRSQLRNKKPPCGRWQQHLTGRHHPLPCFTQNGKYSEHKKSFILTPWGWFSLETVGGCVCCSQRK